MSRETWVPAAEKISRVEAIVQQTPEVAGFQAYEYFRNNSAAQKTAFIEGAQASLELVYPALYDGRINEIAVQTEKALRVLMPKERTQKSEVLYSAVEYRYSEMFLTVMAAKMNDITLSAAEEQEAKNWFKMTNEALYGIPDKSEFSALSKKYIAPTLKLTHLALPTTSLLSAELNELVGDIDETDYQLYEPKPDVLERVGNLTRERFEGLVEHVDTEANYDVPATREALEGALEKLGALALGWRSEIVPNSSALAVSAHQKLVEVGDGRASLKGDELRGLILHEVGIHALRSVNAERADWLSAQYGQDGYLDFEEALATSLQAAYKGEYSISGVNHYLTAGLAYGLDNHEPRDMREVYEIMWRVHALRSADSKNDISAEQIRAAKTDAFNGCMRLFRGTSTIDKGLVYLKDLAYFKGQTLAWSYLENVHSQADFELLLAGKLDLTKPDHLKIAKEIVSTNKS